jgi:glutamate racemase
MIKIGVFDSGIGGVRFAKDLQATHPDYKVSVVHDRKNMPYGNKSPEEIQAFTEAAIKPLLGADIIAIACNTATAYAIDYLRSKHPDQLFVGFEPAIRVASKKSRTRKIAVLATPATLKSARYQTLKAPYFGMLEIFEPNVSLLAHQIETRSVNWRSLESLIKNLVHNQVDQIVLGCTHYHLIKNTIASFSDKQAEIITPTKAVINQIDSLLAL